MFFDWHGDHRALPSFPTRRSSDLFPIPTAADVVKFDSGLKRIYAACASGVIAVIQEDDRGHSRKLEDFRVEPKVHSLAVDVETHRVYAPEQEEGGRPVSRMIVYEAVSQP